jgi:arylsulfatase A-like enzyme
MRLRATIALLITPLLLVALINACSEKEPPEPRNVVLITIDGLRADFLTPERMPLLHEFAEKRCRIFEEARANSTWGKPSHATLLTGLLQSEHGVEYNDSAAPIEVEMIQEKLQKGGYTTAAFVCGNNLGAEFGFDRGFDKFHNVAESLSESGSFGETIAEHHSRRMTTLNEAEHFANSHPALPVFLYVQTDAVKDYWLDAFPQDTRISDEIERLRQEEEFMKADRPLWQKFKTETSTDRKRYLYGAAVRALDQRLHDFLLLLQYSPIFPNTKIIITSGHGEGLRDEHGQYISYGHAAPPYSDQINVPLVVYGLDKGRTDRLVGLDDIAGTILTFAGLEKEPAKSLFRRRERIISEYTTKDKSDTNRAAAYIWADRKFLISTDSNVHMFMDPLDADDLIHLQHTEVKKEDISQELKEQLGALGYMQ